MRSRLSLFLNDLALDEILYLEDELDRRKEKYHRHYAVLSVQADKPVLRPEHSGDLGEFARVMRRYISGSAAAGGGTVLAHSPEVSMLLFHSVASAGRCCTALLSGLPEFNGRFARQSLRIGLKLGLASGVDTLAPGSPRCVRTSPLVRRANQIAWRSTPNALLMDEHSHQEWPEKFSLMAVPFEVEGQRVFRVMPTMLNSTDSRLDNEGLLRFLRQVTSAGIATLKYDMIHVAADTALVEKWKLQGEAMAIALEAYDPKTSQNLSFVETLPAVETPARMDAIKQTMTAMGLALVRHEISVTTGV